MKAQDLINSVTSEQEKKRKLIYNQPKSFWKRLYKKFDSNLKREFA